MIHPNVNHPNLNHPDMNRPHTAADPRLLAVDWGADSLATVDLTTPEEPRSFATAVERNPRAVAVSTDGTRAYVANHGSGTLSVVDLAAGGAPAVLRSVEAGNTPCAVVAGLAHDQVCVADRAGGTVVVFDKEGHRPVELQVGAGPCALAAAPSGRFVCVVDETDETVAVVDVDVPGAPCVTATVPVPGVLRALAVSAGGRFAYVASRGDGTAGSVTVLALDGGASPVGAPVAVGAEPRAIALSPAGDRICVANHGSASVTIADVAPDTGLLGSPDTLDVGPHPVAVAFAPDGGTIHVVSRTAGTLTAVDLDTGDRTDLPVGAVPSAVVCGSDGRHAYVTDQATGQLIAVRAAPRRTGETGTGAGSRPVGLAVSPDGRWAYAADSATDRVALLDLGGQTPGDPVRLGDPHQPWGVAIAPDRSLACATSPGSAHLLVIEPAPGDVLDGAGAVRVRPVALAQGAQPRGVAVTPDSRLVVTADAGTATVSLVDPRGGSYMIGQRTVDCEQPSGAALSGDGRTLYVADFGHTGSGQAGGQIAVLRRTGPSQWQHVGVITTEVGRFYGPHELALSPDEQRLYVVNYERGGVSVLDRDSGGDTWTFRTAVTKSGMTRPYGVALSPDGHTLYVSNAANSNGTVEVFGVSAEEAVFQRTVMVKRGPANADIYLGLGLSPDGQFLYAADPEDWSAQGKGSVYGVRVMGDAPPAQMQLVVAPSEAGIFGPSGLVCPDNTTLCVVNRGRSGDSVGQACLSVITLDASRLGVAEAKTTPLAGADLPYAAAVSADGTLCVANFDGKTVTVFGTQVTPVPVGGQGPSRPWDVCVTPDGVHAYATDRAAGALRCVRIADHDVTSVVVGEDPTGVASGPDGIHAYVANHGDDSVSVLRRALEPTGVTLPVTGGPHALAVHPGGDVAYLARDGGLDAIDLGGARTGAGLDLGTALCAVAVHPAGAYAYAADAGGSVPAVHVVDLALPARPARAAVPPVELTGGARPTGIALRSGQPWGYVSGAQGPGSTGALWVLNTASPQRPSVTGAVEQPFPAIDALAIHPGTPGHLYLLTRSDGVRRLRVLALTDDPAKPRPLPGPGIELPADARDIAVHPGGGHALVGTESGAVHVLGLADPARPRLAGSTRGPGARAVPAHRPDGRGALCLAGDVLAELALGVPAVVATWRDPRLVRPRSVAVSADGAWLFVTTGNAETAEATETSGTLLMLDTRTGTLRFTVPAGTALAGIAPHPERQRVHLADQGGATVPLVDTTPLTRVGATALGLDPRQVVRAPGTA
ncbi:beta-propeller fold lactonase family protein [Streptomyces sp. NBC_00536]|uniref:beta-propeller fold lactonase family protein n=1 Tax=Streptomyces sp. NBC_00536 TaxID=2975769 RepID=UPI002E80DF40|nr:beta-propeller fold lactonase family protein [Streptomyces sp. NBC_00536]WUC82454.1 beta-propeller fold lactonase family protein [Streptomyces sp. NBC_00536]